MKMDIKLDIFTLNCWGIVGVSRHRKERMAAIASHLAESKYDFVFLQEVWCQSDYEMICKKTAHVLPYAYYFHSGVLGSGVCILSQSPIVDVAQHKFSLNGYAHKILHGDWFGGKVIGLCKVKHCGLRINLYVTHLHAEYDSFHDSYLPHRIAQAFEMSQFIKMTSETADLSILAGDFNTEPCDLLYRLIMRNTGCIDSYLMRPDVTNCSAEACTTCGHPDNMYTCQRELRECPMGKRIDYIMYKCGTGTSVSCLSCGTPLGKIPDSSIPYSDHEAVVAKLHIFKTMDAPIYKSNPQACVEAITDAHAILDTSIKSLSYNQMIYLLMSFLVLCAIVLCTYFKEVYGLVSLFTTLQVFCSISMAFFLWMGTVMNRMEHSALISTCKSMNILVDALSSEYELDVSNQNQSEGGPYSQITM